MGLNCYLNRYLSLLPIRIIRLSFTLVHCIPRCTDVIMAERADRAAVGYEYSPVAGLIDNCAAGGPEKAQFVVGLLRVFP
jgi:hypothetical protein